MDAEEIVIPKNFRLFSGAVGLITLLISLFLFLQPNILIEVWPWTLTPLTARVMGAMFALPGLVGLGLAMDQRWSAAGLILQSQGFSILLERFARRAAGGCIRRILQKKIDLTP